MRQGLFEIAENTAAAPGVFRLRLAGDSSAIAAPGQFANLRIDGFFLRRPLAVSDWDADGFTVFYKVVGGGTAALSGLPAGGRLDVLTGLGNGFDVTAPGREPALIGGGCGVFPFPGLARRLWEAGKRPTAVLGFAAAADVCLRGELEALGVPVRLATMDGSAGARGPVTAALEGCRYDYFYACGPEAMLRAVDRAAVTDGELSFEERMGCGFGACMGCSCRTKYGTRRICRDGPVLKRGDILW